VERYLRDASGAYRTNSSGAPIESTTYGIDANRIYPESACKLYVLSQGGAQTSPRVSLLFPRPEHSSLVDRNMVLGCALDPQMSLDGRTLYFSYFHDVAVKDSFGAPLYGSDLYKIDLGPLIDNPAYTGALTPQRLTFQPANRFESAMNPTLANTTSLGWGGSIRMGPAEVETVFGKELFYVSNERKLQNSNFQSPINLNLFHSLINPNGTLGVTNQFKYFTTTSVLSPTNLRDGVAVSYQERTTDVRKWSIQSIDSAGRWAPLHGYGASSAISFHLGALCPNQPNDASGTSDVWVSNVYYVGNNNGFGALRGVRTITQGLNQNFALQAGVHVPKQLNENNLTQFVRGFEDESSAIQIPSGSGNLQLIGKFTTPSCGLPGELFAAYSPTCANHRLATDDCKALYGNQGLYRSHIVLRQGLLDGAGQPQELDPQDPNVYRKVIEDSSGLYSLIHPRVIGVSHQQRFGVPAVVSLPPSSVDGMPVAEVGSSAIHNTDRTPPECIIRTNPPKFSTRTLTDPVLMQNSLSASAPLGWVRDHAKLSPTHPDSVCENPLNPNDVLGIMLYVTDNKTDPTRLNPTAERKEAIEMLGVVPAANMIGGNPNDTSFAALVPAKQPLKWQALDKRYGLALMDMPSWHDLAAGEIRVSCGGCHNHQPNKGLSWNDKAAAQPTYPQVDLLRYTPYIKYDSQCTPTFAVENVPTRKSPVWGDNSSLFQKFNQYCGSCHASGQSGAGAFVVSNAENTFQAISNPPDRHGRRRFYSTILGPLSSQLCWAARGERMDGRDNTFYDPVANPQNAALEFFFTEGPHAGLGLCSGTRPDAQEAADFVYELCHWIETGARREAEYPTNASYASTMPSSFDRMHPSVSGTLANHPTCSVSGGLKVGFWDNSGKIARLAITGPGINVQIAPSGGLPNGFHVFNEVAQLQNSDDIVEVLAEDQAGNRQSYKKTLMQIVAECQTASNPRRGPGYGSFPTPAPTPTPEPTPPGGGVSGPGSGGGAALISLKRGERRVGPGAIVRLNLAASGAVGESPQYLIAGSKSGKNPGFLLGNLHVSLNLDGYTNISLSNLQGLFTAARAGQVRARVDLEVPRSCRQARNVALHHQAALLTEFGVSALSESLQFVIDGRVSPKGKSALEKELDNAQKKLRSLKARRATLKNATAKINAAKLAVSKLKNERKVAKARGKILLGAVCSNSI
jgi:hypothetical protein